MTEYVRRGPGLIAARSTFFTVPSQKQLTVRFKCKEEFSFYFGQVQANVQSFAVVEYETAIFTTGVKDFDNLGKSMSMMSGVTDNYAGSSLLTTLMALETSELLRCAGLSPGS